MGVTTGFPFRFFFFFFFFDKWLSLVLKRDIINFIKNISPLRDVTKASLLDEDVFFCLHLS